MRVVLDTNLWISGLLWLGPPHDVLALVEAGKITPCETQELLDELVEVLHRPRLSDVIRRRGTSPDELFASVESSVILCDPASTALPRDLRDRDDASVFHCAVAANAKYIVSGDDDLLVLGEYAGIQVVSPGSFLKLFNES